VCSPHTEQDLGARRRPPKPFEREPSAARVLRINCARSDGAAARRRPGVRIIHASPRRGLTHPGQDPPAAGCHGAPRRVLLRGDRQSPIASGNGSRYPEACRGCTRRWEWLPSARVRESRSDAPDDATLGCQSPPDTGDRTRTSRNSRIPFRHIHFQMPTSTRHDRLMMPPDRRGPQAGLRLAAADSRRARNSHYPKQQRRLFGYRRSEMRESW
jgi:hypothetical protein